MSDVAFKTYCTVWPDIVDWADQSQCEAYSVNGREEKILLSHQPNMLRVPFPSSGTENITLFRGGKRARRDALKDGLFLSRSHIPHRSDETSIQ